MISLAIGFTKPARRVAAGNVFTSPDEEREPKSVHYSGIEPVQKSGRLFPRVALDSLLVRILYPWAML